MGISTGCALIVGLLADELPKALIDECEAGDYYEILGEDGRLGLHGVSPYFDCPWTEQYWGVCIGHEYWGGMELPADLNDKIEKAKATFREKVGAEPKVFISPDVC